MPSLYHQRQHVNAAICEHAMKLFSLYNHYKLSVAKGFADNKHNALRRNCARISRCWVVCSGIPFWLVAEQWTEAVRPLFLRRSSGAMQEHIITESRFARTFTKKHPTHPPTRKPHSNPPKKAQPPLRFPSYSAIRLSISFQTASCPRPLSDEKTINGSPFSISSVSRTIFLCLSHLPFGILSAFVAMMMHGIS